MAQVKLYIGNLPWSVTSDQLGQKFTEAGNVVSAQVVTDKYSGRSRGFGFVEMASEDEGNKAIELFNGKDFEGRQIVVNVARPREEGDQPQRGGMGGAQSQQPAADPMATDDTSAPADQPKEEEIVIEPKAKPEKKPKA